MSNALGALPTQSLNTLRLCAVTSKELAYFVQLYRLPAGHLLIGAVPAYRWSAERGRHSNLMELVPYPRIHLMIRLLAVYSAGLP